jgi:protoheme IX farnesyltransferase
MSTSTLTIARDQPTRLSRLADFAELSKPKISALLLVAVAVAYAVSRWGQPEPLVLLHVLLGMLLVAASASSLNQLLERDSDALMQRTAGRPLAAGRLAVRDACWYAGCTFIAGSMYLLLAVGWQPAFWAVVTWVTYVWVYTPLKPVTWLNTAIGAIAGALPVLIGWSAGGAYDLRAGSLFLLLFLWQFPHFMAIAWLYREQYERAGMKMLTVVDPGGRRAGSQAVLSALALVPVSLIPVINLPGLSVVIYASGALLLGLAQLAFAWSFLRRRDEQSARRLLRASLAYLPAVLLLVLLVPWL